MEVKFFQIPSWAFDTILQVTFIHIYLNKTGPAQVVAISKAQK